MSHPHGRFVAAIITAACCLLGLGAATLAANALAASAPDDGHATSHGSGQLPADQLINYGG